MNEQIPTVFPSLELLGNVFRSYPAIQAVYLFGSVARGKAHTTSDLDIGIVSSDSSVHKKKLDLLADLARLGFCRIDLVFLDTDDIVLRFEVVRQNRVIYQKSGFDPSDFYSKTLRMYSDFLPYLRLHREAFRRRLTGDENPEIVRKRLTKLELYLGILQRMRRYSYEEFTSDPERYGSAERFLHLSIEAINDIGNHVVADERLGEVNWQSDIPKLLARHGYVSHDLAESWIRMIGFRNVLVHDYLEIDHKIVHEVIMNDLHDLGRLMEVFAGWL